MSIRVVDPTCTECGKPLTDPASRAFRIGPECRKGMTTRQLREAMARAAQADDPFRIPEPRPASIQARLNNRNARASVEPDAVQLCRHEQVAGRCGACRREADPHRAAERILAEVCSSPHTERRAERARVLAARYAHIPEWTRPEWLRKDGTQHGRRQAPPPAAPPQIGQMELL